MLNPALLGGSVPGWVARSYPGIFNSISLAAHFDAGQYWARGGGLSPVTSLLTTTRASTGYAATSSGLLVSFLSNIPRITDLGLLVEQAATNLALQSQTFDNSFWAKNNCTVTADQAVAPDGTQTADLVVPAAASGTYKTVQSGGVGIALTGNAAVSVYYKPSGYGFLAIVGSSNVGRLTVNVASNTFVSYGAAGLSAVSTALGNGWYRVVVSATAWASGASVWFGPINAQADPSTAWTADGVSGGYLWGAQGEAGSFPTSYIPTTTVAVTRAADMVVYPHNPLGTGNFTMLVSVAGVPAQTGKFPTLLSVNGGSGVNETQIYSTNGGNTTSGKEQITVSIFDTIIPVSIVNGAGKVAMTLNGTAARGASNGGNLAALGTWTTSSAFTQMQIGTDNGGTNNPLNGYVRRVAIFQAGMTDAQMQAVTT